MTVPFPEAFERRVKNDPFLGEHLLTALNDLPPVSVRLHPTKIRPQLHESGPVAWCKDAVYLAERPLFTLDPLFHSGSYYPQEAGSMIIGEILQALGLPSQPKILDLCAAPGGKSTLIASFLANRGLLVANEVIQSRSRILKENLTKWGYTNTMVTNNDPADFSRLPHFFDAVLVDAPCSGEGMFRKDPAARNEWSAANVNLCTGRQKRIIEDVWSALKPGGWMIYSTCTFNAHENEENVEWMIAEFGARLVEFPLPDEVIAGRNGIGAYFIPGKTMSEGFYVAVLQKEEGAVQRTRFARKSEFKRQKDCTSLIGMLQLSEVQVINWNEQLIAVPADQEENMLHVQAQMKIQKMGTFLGEQTRKGIIPNEELVFNPFLFIPNKTVELDVLHARKYLHGDTFPLNIDHGFHVVTFQNQPLGWIKQVGNRFNNLYPKEWRIRMQID
jgi:16S rRNA C967 or C1407 C5-methylase (RsmB/RsmF family)/NOL1/NOP2/fmu family ribosome biogenesis protein